MGSCFKPTRIDPRTGRRVKYRRYRIVWVDELGRRRTAMAYSDHAASRAMLARKETEAARRREGLPVADQGRLLMPAGEFLDAFARELVSRGSEPGGTYVREATRTLRAVFSGCGWSSLGQVRVDGFRGYLAGLAERGLAPGTRQRHGDVLRNAVRWAVDQGWLAADPLAGLKPVRVGEAGKRRRRRALTRPELLALLAAVPERRANLYRLAALSGLRRKELRLMRKGDLDPVGPKPCWRLRAEAAKNRRLDVVPICPDALAVALPAWELLPLPTSRLLSSPLLWPAVPSHETFTADLARAGIPKVDGEGRRCDFHCLRYTFCRLMAEVLPIQVVKVLMRHSSIKLTADLYLSLGIEDVGERVWRLPSVLS